MNVHNLVFGGGAQTIRIAPTYADGDPMICTGAQARIVDLTVGEDSSDYVILAKAAVTPDSTTGTTTAAVGPTSGERRQISVATPGDFTEGRSYVLIGTDGRRQEVVIERVGASAVYTRDDVRFLFPSGSTLRGFGLEVEFPASEADDEDAFDDHKGDTQALPYAVDWYFTAASPDPDPTQARELVYVRRHAQPVLARVSDVELLDTRFAGLNSRSRQVEKALEQAHRDFFRMVREKHVEPDRYLFGNSGRDAVARMASERLCRSLGTERDDDMADIYRREWGAIMQNLGGTQDVHVGRSTDTASLDAHERLKFRRP